MDPGRVGSQEWPNQALKILIPGWTLMIISTGFLVWRVVYGIQQRRNFMFCDYLLIIAALLNIASVSINHIVVDAALGRHIQDPSIGLPNIMKYSYWLWITQVVNIVAVAFLKWSICTWLLVLKFSRIYQVIVWLSILMVTAFNLLAPVLTLFGCYPLEANWNYGYTGADKKCWAKGTLELSYTQGISNVLTDVVYMAAPLIYISQVQLNKKTQWGIRIVFLLSIPATICSIFKTIELKTITQTADPTWDGVNLAIWSASELSIGILIASLPPLRKAFDGVFRRLLPSAISSSKTPNQLHYGYGHSTHGNHIRLDTYENNYRNRKSVHQGDSVLDNDSDSERAILEDGPKGSGIVKTTKVTVMEGEEKEPRDSLQHKCREWDNSPDLERNERQPHAR